MPVRDTVSGRAKQATQASRNQVHAYLGAYDLAYERARAAQAAGRQSRPRIGLPVDTAALLRDTLQASRPSRIRGTVSSRLDEARRRQHDLSTRGERVVQDWRRSTAIQDVTALVSGVRAAGGPVGVVRSLGDWAKDYPTTV